MEIKEMLIQAINDAVAETFATVLSLTCVIKDRPAGWSSDSIQKPVVASIGMAGMLEGSLVLIFPDQSACKIVSIMLGSEYKEVNQDVLDGSGEMANILAGGLKTRLSNTEYKFDISIPMVLQSKDPLNIARLQKFEAIELYAQSQGFDFAISLFYSIITDAKVSEAKEYEKKVKAKIAADSLKDMIK